MPILIGVPLAAVDDAPGLAVLPPPAAVLPGELLQAVRARLPSPATATNATMAFRNERRPPAIRFSLEATILLDSVFKLCFCIIRWTDR
jgi:hypothetical protein